MGHSYASNVVHIVFSTKERRPYMSDQTPERLWAYIDGIARNHGIPLIAVGGTTDHVHILASLPATMTLSDLVRNIKANSSRLMRQHVRDFSWQEGYGAFSVSS